MRRRGWAVYFLGALILVGVLADVIASDRPLAVRDASGWQFPALHRASVAGAALTYETAALVVWAPVPFAARDLELSGSAYLPPLSRDVRGRRHWLGTDRLGRDTAAGLVAGTRIAVIVGLGSLVLALLVGLPLGGLAGFYGDQGVRVRIDTLLATVVGGVLGVGYSLASLAPLAANFFSGVGLMVLPAVVMGCALWILLRVTSRWWAFLRRRVRLPIDRLVLLLLELTVSIPGLVLLVVLLSFVSRPSLLVVVLVIGTLGWAPIARFLRGELMRIRELPYVAAARLSGIGEWRVLIRHALVNAAGPVTVTAAFMVGSSILAEAMLSFLGVGVPVEQVTWGSLLQQSRAQPAAWWLAVFPGLLLTLTVLACNSIRVHHQRQSG